MSSVKGQYGIDPLPDFWSVAATNDGRIFFINEHSRETSWLHPNGYCIQSGYMPDEDLPDFWESGVTAAGALYYVDHRRGVTTFERPVPNNGLNRSQSQRTGSIISGWLYKQEGVGSQAWKWRYCSLIDGILHIYNDEKTAGQKDALASLVLSTYILSACSDLSKPYAFKLEHRMRAVYMAADSEREWRGWMEALSYFCVPASVASVEPYEKPSYPERTNLDSSRQYHTKTPEKSEIRSRGTDSENWQHLDSHKSRLNRSRDHTYVNDEEINNNNAEAIYSRPLPHYLRHQKPPPSPDRYTPVTKSNTTVMHTIPETDSTLRTPPMPRPERNTQNKWQPGGRLSISAVDLIGKTQEELVLLLIQLRRAQAQLKQQSRPNSSVNTEVYAPLINLVDNLVTLGSLYDGEQNMFRTQYKQHKLKQGEWTAPKPMIEWSRQRQERELKERNRRNLSYQANHTDMNMNDLLERQHQLDVELQQKSYVVTSLHDDLLLLERSLARTTQPSHRAKLESEIRSVRHQLADASSQVEYLASQSRLVEDEILALKKVNDLSRSVSSPSLLLKAAKSIPSSMPQLNSVLDTLSTRQSKLSEAMVKLRHSTPDLNSLWKREENGDHRNEDNEVAISHFDISEADENTKRYFGITAAKARKASTVREVKKREVARKERLYSNEQPPRPPPPPAFYNLQRSQSLPRSFLSSVKQKEFSFDPNDFEREVLDIPEKVPIPIRYIPEVDDYKRDETPEEKAERNARAEKLRALLADQSLQDYSAPTGFNSKHSVEEEKLHRETVLQKRRELAHQASSVGRLVNRSNSPYRPESAPPIHTY
ncbi:DgyrCDS7771 [Dimorphilus gyrociliatus]|uniref:DgyrCDS7771 n=1 Tax=Dimorphilus gyrociliatus TaxID=2664684 RepID=A0A7I8VS91_9ANNE|nr:DgyrCDS7771 [Dimorphilus gyrociliatus]